MDVAFFGNKILNYDILLYWTGVLVGERRHTDTGMEEHEGRQKTLLVSRRQRLRQCVYKPRNAKDCRATRRQPQASKLLDGHRTKLVLGPSRFQTPSLQHGERESSGWFKFAVLVAVQEKDTPLLCADVSFCLGVTAVKTSRQAILRHPLPIQSSSVCPRVVCLLAVRGTLLQQRKSHFFSISTMGR